MDKIDELLQYVRKTNPEMTRARLIFELSQSRYSTAGLWNTYKNSAFNKGKRLPSLLLSFYAFLW